MKIIKRVKIHVFDIIISYCARTRSDRYIHVERHNELYAEMLLFLSWNAVHRNAVFLYDTKQYVQLSG